MDIFKLTMEGVKRQVSLKKAWGLLPANLEITGMSIDAAGRVERMTATATIGGRKTKYEWTPRGEYSLFGWIMESSYWVGDDSINIYV